MLPPAWTPKLGRDRIADALARRRAGAGRRAEAGRDRQADDLRLADALALRRTSREATAGRDG